MASDKVDRDCSSWARSSSSEKSTAGEDEDAAQRKARLESLRRQVRAGAYHPAIGDIAVKLIKSRLQK